MILNPEQFIKHIDTRQDIRRVNEPGPVIESAGIVASIVGCKNLSGGIARMTITPQGVPDYPKGNSTRYEQPPFRLSERDVYTVTTNLMVIEPLPKNICCYVDPTPLMIDLGVAVSSQIYPAGYSGPIEALVSPFRRVEFVQFYPIGLLRFGPWDVIPQKGKKSGSIQKTESSDSDEQSEAPSPDGKEAKEPATA